MICFTSRANNRHEREKEKNERRKKSGRMTKYSPKSRLLCISTTHILAGPSEIVRQDIEQDSDRMQTFNIFSGLNTNKEEEEEREKVKHRTKKKSHGC